jgi:DNA-binding NarL/FixJ family response regulator
VPDTVRVVLADDSGIFREGLRLLLEAAGVDVVAAVGTVPALTEAVARTRPDVAVVDVRMPPTFTDEGLRAVVTLRRDHADLGLLVLSTSVDAVSAAQLLDAVPTGVGYLLKDRVDDISSLTDSLNRVARGGVALDSQVVRSVLSCRSAVVPLQRLTAREQEVLALLAEGRSNAGIAERLVLSPKTVETHVAAIFRAFDLEPHGAENRRVRAALAYLRLHRDLPTA